MSTAQSAPCPVAADGGRARPALRRRGRLFGANTALAACVLAAALAGLVFGEKIPVGGGLGWDGSLYGAWARDFYGHVVERGLDRYYVQRILPSALVHCSLCLFCVPRTDPNIIAAFGVLNVALLALTAYVWGRLADATGVSAGGKWLGAAALFVNFAVLKWASYDPVLTDVSALALGMLMLYCYLTDRFWALAAVTALGAFTWPALIYQGAFLLVFPRARGAGAADSPPARAWGPHTLLAAATAALVFGFQLYLLRTGDSALRSVFVSAIQRFVSGVVQPFSMLAAVSAACVAVYLFCALRGLWARADFFRPGYWGRSAPWRRVAVVALLMAAIDRLAAWASRPATFGLGDYGLLFAWESMRLPGIFYLGHVVFFGPLFLLVLLRLRPLFRAVRSHGLGPVLCFTFNLLLSLDPQSRHLLHFLPLLVFFAVKTVDHENWRLRHIAAFAVLAAAFSKVWLRLGPVDPPMDQFPAQRLFMNLGDWMSPAMYAVQGAAAVLSGGLLFFLSPSRSEPPAARANEVDGRADADYKAGQESARDLLEDRRAVRPRLPTASHAVFPVAACARESSISRNAKPTG